MSLAPLPVRSVPPAGSCPSAYRFRLLGVAVDAVDQLGLLDVIEAAIAGDRRWLIANHNLHSLYLYHHDRHMRSFYERADLIHADGMSIVLLARLLGLPMQRGHRLGCMDWIDASMKRAAARGWRVFLLGSSPEVGARAATLLRSKFPGLEVRHRHGYFDPEPAGEENRRVVRQICCWRPHLLFVGMGMPRQERWILENLEDLSVNVVFNVGGCIEFLAAVRPTPPRWTGRWGMEWLFRLAMEPRRLWRRYLLEPWFILWLLLQEVKGRPDVSGESHNRPKGRPGPR